jgi:hypothetical protein
MLVPKGGDMKTSAAIALALLASVLVAVPASSHGNASSARSATNPPASALLPHGMFGPRQDVFYGYVRSVTRSGARYVMRVDPGLVLSGLTATRAAVEDGVIAPGEPVPNDFYNVNERTRLYTYRLAANARITVLVAGPRSVVVPVSEFAQIVKGENPEGRPGLWGPASGFWIRVEGDRALALNQAYRP